MKTCIYCGKNKPFTEYHKKSGNKDGHDGRCKECCKEYKRTGKRKMIQKQETDKIAWTPRLKRIKDCYLTENDGEYSLHINGGQPLPASDVEVVLWKRIEVLQKRLEMIGG